jgi:hypothetical protein
MNVFEGARDGVATEGRRAKEERRKESSTSAESSIPLTTDLENLNMRVGEKDV